MRCVLLRVSVFRRESRVENELRVSHWSSDCRQSAAAVATSTASTGSEMLRKEREVRRENCATGSGVRVSARAEKLRECASRISRCCNTRRRAPRQVRPAWRVRDARASGSSARTGAAAAAPRGTRVGGRRGSRARSSSATPAR